MTSLISFFTICWFYSFGAVLSDGLPSYIKVCHRDNPNMGSCMIDAIENVRPHLIKGIPELNTPSIDPLLIGDIALISSKSEKGIQLDARELYVHGAGGFRIEKFKINNLKYKVRVKFDKLHIAGQYSVAGNLLAIPIVGAGPFTANFTDCNAIIDIQLEIFEINNIKYLRLESLDINAKIGGGSIQLNNLFNGNKKLGKAINEMINKNIFLLFDDMGPVVFQSVANKLESIANKILRTAPYDTIFPE